MTATAEEVVEEVEAASVLVVQVGIEIEMYRRGAEEAAVVSSLPRVDGSRWEKAVYSRARARIPVTAQKRAQYRLRRRM